MNKYLLICFFVCLQKIDSAYAFEVDQDTLRLNPEFMRAIQNGTLINMDKPDQNLRQAPLLLPIYKDFSEYIKLDSTLLDSVDYRIVPPSVLLLHKVKEKEGKKVTMKMPPNPPLPKTWLRVGKTPIEVKTGADNLFLEEVKDGQRRGSINVSTKFTFSINDVLETIFSKRAREKKRNKKRLETWKYYNDCPK